MADFPRQRAIDVIDGRAQVSVHGERDMPVWGDWFKFEANSGGAGEKTKKLSVSGLLRLWTISKAFSNIDRQVHDALAAYSVFLWRSRDGSILLGILPSQSFSQGDTGEHDLRLC